MVQKLVEYTGNQWNESWGWKRKELEQLPISELESLYAQIKDKNSLLWNDTEYMEAHTLMPWKSSCGEEVLLDLHDIVNKYIRIVNI